MSVPSSPSVAAAPAVEPIPLRAMVPWLVLGSVLAFGMLFLVSAEPGAYVHEWMHDGRHLLGFPCH